MRKKAIHNISPTLLSGALLLSLASCINDNYLDDVQYADGKVSVELSIQARSLSNSISSNSETYVPGTEWENYIDIAGGDYRIYFFEYDPQTETGSGSGASSKLIAEFTPTSIYSTDLDTYTTYTLSGEVAESLIESLTNFKVVVVANWGENNYPTNLTTGTTTIDDICNAGKFSTFVQNGTATMPSASNLIPFFGLREYSGVTWKDGTMTRLNGDITLLRSVAKVEVILEPTEEQPDLTFEDVSVVNYNAQGYCAPTGVYLKSDYDHDGDWKNDFVDGLHLVNDGKNDEGQDDTNTISMYKTTNSEGKETWTCYLPEYNNAGTDYSYISVTINEVPYKIYFANYTEGGTTAYDEEGNTDDRYDIYRNYLYRFYVSYKYNHISVWVHKWDDRYTNVFGFDSDYEASDSGDGDGGESGGGNGES